MKREECRQAGLLALVLTCRTNPALTGQALGTGFRDFLTVAGAYYGAYARALVRGLHSFGLLQGLRTPRRAARLKLLTGLASFLHLRTGFQGKGLKEVALKIRLERKALPSFPYPYLTHLIKRVGKQTLRILPETLTFFDLLFPLLLLVISYYFTLVLVCCCYYSVFVFLNSYYVGTFSNAIQSILLFLRLLLLIHVHVLSLNPHPSRNPQKLPILNVFLMSQQPASENQKKNQARAR